MDYREFVRTVADRAAVSREEAADLARAVVETLSNRLSSGAARSLAECLPPQLRDSLHVPERIERIGLRDLVRRVSSRTGLTAEEVRGGVSAVLTTLRDTVPKEVFERALAQLPGEFKQAAS